MTLVSLLLWVYGRVDFPELLGQIENDVRKTSLLNRILWTSRLRVILWPNIYHPFQMSSTATLMSRRFFTTPWCVKILEKAAKSQRSKQNNSRKRKLPRVKRFKNTLKCMQPAESDEEIRGKKFSDFWKNFFFENFLSEILPRQRFWMK